MVEIASRRVETRVGEPMSEERAEESRLHRWPPMTYWAKVTVVVLLTFMLLRAASLVSSILLLVVMALVIAVGLDPAVRYLQRFRLRRGTATAAIFVAVLAFLALFVILLGPPLARQISDLAGHIPDYVQKLANRDDAIGKYFRAHDITQNVKDFVEEIPTKVARSFDTVLGIAGKLGSLAFQLVTIAILTIYFMLSLPNMRRTAVIVFSPERREQGEHVLNQAVEKIGGYVGGNLVTSSICGLASMFALLVLGVPFAIPLAMWAGVADLIPQVGSYLGAAPAVLIGFLQSPLTGVLVLVYFIVYQQFENYFLVPRVMKDAVDLSPAAVIISTLIAGSLLGFAGALLALPVAATIKVVIYDVWLHDRIEGGDELAREHVEEKAEAEAEAEAVSQARAEARRGALARIMRRDRFRRGRRGPSDGEDG
jgi:predicted PurR-regulated permease PerM